jgi:glycosyltransferase involved in cell wall biosynthesis
VLQSGFNVIGYASANLGLGAAARTTIRLLLECGRPVAVVDVDAGFGRSGVDHSFDHLRVGAGREPPHAINLIHLNPPEYEAFCKKGFTWLRPGERFNALVPFWELPVVPQCWIPPLRRLDLILAPTRYIEHMMAVQAGGVPVRHYPQTVFIPPGIAPDRAAFALPADALLFVMGFEMFSDINRKNPWAAIEAFDRAFTKGDNVALVVKVNNPGALASFAAPLEKLRAAAERNGRILIIDRPLSHRDVLTLYASCDVLVSLHRAEGLGLSPMEAMALGKPVIATDWSGNMDFMTDANSCLVGHRLVAARSDAQSGYNPVYVGADTVWADPDIDEAASWMRRLAADAPLRARVGGRALASMRATHAACRTGKTWREVDLLREHTLRVRELRGPTRTAKFRRGLRVLFCNRGNAFDMPGGDTVVMRRLKEGLERNGAVVELCGDPRVADMRPYDLIHAFNLTLPAVAEATARSAIVNNKPLVVTTLQEDFTRYLHKAAAACSWFASRAAADAVGRSAMLPLEAALAAAAPAPLLTSPLAGRAANLLFACGESEAALLRGWFGHDRTASVPFGSSVRDLPVGPSLFEERFGVRDFVLCVGRVEPRKNQLMLLYALEQSAIPVVFADGGFTYQPGYLALCRTMKRRGPTVYTGRLTDELLVSAYRACRLHCLPSWYELPGLVSLEAALYGCGVAASSWGSLPDYLGDSVAWFEPDDPAGMRAIVESGFGRTDASAAVAAERARSFTWEFFVTRTLEHYERVVDDHVRFAPALVEEAEKNLPTDRLVTFVGTIVGFVEKGRFADALRYYDTARKSVAGKFDELDKVDALMEKVRRRESLKPAAGRAGEPAKRGSPTGSSKKI